MTATTDPRIALYQCALGVAKDAMEAFTDPDGRMPADTGEFKDLKTALVAIRTVYPLCDEFRPTKNLLAENDKLRTLNAELAEACATMVAWDDAENAAPTYASDNGAHWRIRQALCADAFGKARAALAKNQGVIHG